MAISDCKAAEHTTASAQMAIVVEGFPEIVEGLVSWFRTSINQDTYLRLFRNVSSEKLREGVSRG
jgi:hypothetical protein